MCLPGGKYHVSENVEPTEHHKASARVDGNGSRQWRVPGTVPGSVPWQIPRLLLLPCRLVSMTGTAHVRAFEHYTGILC